jgi:hypothetical protein
MLGVLTWIWDADEDCAYLYQEDGGREERAGVIVPKSSSTDIDPVDGRTDSDRRTSRRGDCGDDVLAIRPIRPDLNDKGVQWEGGRGNSLLSCTKALLIYDIVPVFTLSEL